MESRARSNINVLASSKLGAILLCFPILNSAAAAPTVSSAADDLTKSDVQRRRRGCPPFDLDVGGMEGRYALGRIATVIRSGWRLRVGLVHGSASGRALEVQGPWRLGDLEYGRERSIEGRLLASEPRVVAQEFDAS